MQFRYACSKATLSRPDGSMPVIVRSDELPLTLGEPGVVLGDPGDVEPEVDEPGMLDEPEVDEPGMLDEPDDEDEPIEDPPDTPDDEDEPIDPGEVEEPGVLRGRAEPLLLPEPAWLRATRLHASKSACVGVRVWASLKPHSASAVADATRVPVSTRVRMRSS